MSRVSGVSGGGGNGLRPVPVVRDTGHRSIAVPGAVARGVPALALLFLPVARFLRFFLDLFGLLGLLAVRSGSLRAWLVVRGHGRGDEGRQRLPDVGPFGVVGTVGVVGRTLPLPLFLSLSLYAAADHAEGPEGTGE
ncbi:hypothetical protein HUT18_22310 [Streptomyces sp. NA04227]|uniref:hypothetical protein n=1 Tax=Streptomyces sp. NA04227 TaxID=2742136 RepID=UPI0015920786|nr:hypothetical protein [Streptomyces sp. NA04227]QKW08699.1 hypothetical protein HUT18_22310 [Streptomyces sp. NA04227]